MILRILLGLLFVASGGEKLLFPYQNFLYVIQNYQILPPFAEESAARVMPWIELILGVFLILGLWLEWTLRGVLIMILGFLLIVGQALIRRLPLEECGCFGSRWSFPLPVTFLMDIILWTITAYLRIRIERTAFFSLDRYFSKTNQPL